MNLNAQFARDGYVVLPDLLPAEACGALRDEAAAIVKGARGPIIGSGDAMSIDSVLAIHFPHKASALMRAAIGYPCIATLLADLIGPDVKAMQSMLFFKNAGKPGQAWHQDEFFIPTRDRSLVGVWIALDDATVDNGCLWVHPGSHRDGILWPMRPHGDPRFDESTEAFDFPYEREGGVALEVAAGGVVLFNGYLLHRSLDNRREQGMRRALVNHYMSARSLLPWWFGGIPTDDFRDVVMVAGDDPYAHKGLADLAFPFVRAEDATEARRVSEAVSAEVRRRHST